MKQKLRLFVAEGQPGEVASVLSELFPEKQGGMELTEISGFPTLMAALEFSDPEVILFDLALAHPEALEAVRRLHRAKPEVPLIAIGDAKDKQTAVASLGEGAMNYLLKGSIDAKTLERALHGALERNTLNGLADLLRDPLTGLYVRDGFLTLGEHAMEAARRKGGDLVLLCARIENGELTREQFGQSTLEHLLREVAALLTRSFRRTDLLGRIGESQFAALALDAVEPSVPVLLQRLRKHLETLNRDDRPSGPLQLRVAARFWPKNAAGTFASFLDEVEAGLRVPPAVPEPEAKTAGLHAKQVLQIDKRRPGGTA
jgi:diguanylate cyclase (GGDEF)-like protein